MKVVVRFLALIVVVFTLARTLMADFEQMVDAAGFVYEKNQDIYISKVDASQRFFGYNELFDYSALFGGMVLDAEPIIFTYSNKRYMIEIWKGQYHLATGAEIGFYEWNGATFDSVKNNEMLFMSYTLKRNGRKVFKRQGIHWWLSGFMPGLFSETDELSLENIYIDFKNSEMRNAFLDALHRIGYDDLKDKIRAAKESTTIIFNVSSPKNQQQLPKRVSWLMQKLNRQGVEQFKKSKAELGIKDNSPQNIDKIKDHINR